MHETSGMDLHHLSGVTPFQAAPTFDYNPADHTMHIHVDANPADDIVVPDVAPTDAAALAPATVDPAADPAMAPLPAQGLPAAAAPAPGDVVDGDPNWQAGYWFHQSTGSTCASSSIADVVNQYTGQHLTDMDVVAMAEAHGIDAANGMANLDQVRSVLADYHINSHLETGSVTDLEHMLHDGHRIIVGVDSAALWHDKPDQGAVDHAVVVTGIDETKGVVYLNDSGASGTDGREETVPISQFEQCWAANGHEMLVTDGSPAADPGAAGGALLPGGGADPTALHLSDSNPFSAAAHAPIAILGFVLHLAESAGKAL